MFIDMHHHHQPSVWAKSLLIGLTLFFWGIALLLFSFLTLHGLFTAQWDWTLIILLPLIILSAFAIWAAYGIVLKRYYIWLKENDF